MRWTVSHSLCFSSPSYPQEENTNNPSMIRALLKLAPGYTGITVLAFLTAVCKEGPAWAEPRGVLAWGKQIQTHWDVVWRQWNSADGLSFCRLLFPYDMSLIASNKATEQQVWHCFPRWYTSQPELLPQNTTTPLLFHPYYAQKPKHGTIPWKEVQDTWAHPCLTPLSNQLTPGNIRCNQRTSVGGKGNACGLTQVGAQCWWHLCKQGCFYSKEEGASAHLTQKQQRGRALFGCPWGFARPGRAAWEEQRVMTAWRCSSHHSHRPCLATITTTLNPATVLLCLSIRNKENENRKAAFRMPEAMQQ